MHFIQFGAFMRIVILIRETSFIMRTSHMRTSHMISYVIGVGRPEYLGLRREYAFLGNLVSTGQLTFDQKIASKVQNKKKIQMNFFEWLQGRKGENAL